MSRSMAKNERGISSRNIKSYNEKEGNALRGLQVGTVVIRRNILIRVALYEQCVR